MLDREKNLQALMDMEMRVKKREALIMGLKPMHYYRGPRSDEVQEGFEFWEFGREVEIGEKNWMVYIKLSIRFENMPVVCMSFHPAERDMIFPYADKR